MPNRTSSVAIVLALACGAVAQDAPPRQQHLVTPLGLVDVLRETPEVATAKATLWIRYADAASGLPDHRQYLEDLQARLGERGITIVVVLPPDQAKALAESGPRFQVASSRPDDAIPETTVVVCRGANELQLVTTHVDGVADALEATLSGVEPDALDAQSALLEQLVDAVADGGEFAAWVESSLAAWPHSGRAHAAAVLYQWWCVGDLVKAREAIDRGLAALAGHAVPMTEFADLVLRGDHEDPTAAKRIAVAMAPSAASASEGVRTQLVYLRALLRSGQERLAGRLAATLPKRLEDRPVDQILFAETLMEGSTPAAFRDAALRAIEAAEKASEALPDARWTWGARHKVLTRCGDADAAQKLMADYRRLDMAQGGLNNDAWYLLVQPQSMGRFDTLALAQCEEMLRVEGAGIDANSQDTVALAFFRNGRVERAVELQQDVTSTAIGPTYRARLRRYEEVLAARKAQTGSGGRR